MSGRSAHWPKVAAVAGLLGIAALVIQGVRLSQRPPQGPVEVAWDRQTCDRCRMLVSEQRFAAQLHTRDGKVLHFDDPGCLLLHAREAAPDVHAAWFHDLDGDAWLERSDVAFVRVAPTPMGYGLGARPASAAQGLSWQEALERVAEDPRP